MNAMSVRGIPVLEGEVARRFIREANANLKKRGSQKLPDETIAACNAILEDARKRGLPF